MQEFCRCILLTTLFAATLYIEVAGQRIDPYFAPLPLDLGSSSNKPTIHSSAVQPDGKLLVGGQFTVAGGLARSGIVRYNIDGTPDPTFDAGDINVAETLLSTSTGGMIEAIRVQPDGKILIGGNYKREVDVVARSIERLNPNGTVDPSFRVPVEIYGINDIELQTDGKIVIGGSFELNLTDPSNGQAVQLRYLARLNSDGSIDYSFRPNALQNSHAVVIQPDGKIVAGNAPTSNDIFQLRRYNTDGSLDSVLATFDDWITGVEQLPDGKFVVTGWFVEVNGEFQKFIARLNPNGTRDASFGSTIGFINALSFQDLAIQPDGKAVVCGEFSSINSSNRWRVARFNTDGTLDETFNTTTPIAGVVSEVEVLQDGKIFIGGAFPRPSNNEFYSNMGRLNSDGAYDSTFDSAYAVYEGEGYTVLQQPDGKVLIGGLFYYAHGLRRRGIVRYNADGTIDTGFVPYPSIGAVMDMILQPDGKIVVVNSDSPSNLYRLNSDGSLDASFHDPFVPFSGSIQKRTRIGQIALQPDGKIVVGGQLITGSATSPSLSGVVRLNPDGSRDATFALVGALGGVLNVWDLEIQNDGRIVIGGDFTRISNDPSYAYLARINTDGTTDTSFHPPAPPTFSPVIYELELQPDGGVVYAGNFNYILRVNADGSQDSSFSTPVSDIVKALEVDPAGRLYVGGYFTNIDGVPRRRIARLTAAGRVDPTWQPAGGANNIVYDLFIQQDGGLLVGGAFTKLALAERIGAGRFYDLNRRKARREA